MEGVSRAGASLDQKCMPNYGPDRGWHFRRERYSDLRSTADLWKQFRPKGLATPQAFARDPKLVSEWYDWRRGLINRAKPRLDTLP